MTEKIKNFQDLSLELTDEQVNRKADFKLNTIFSIYLILDTVYTDFTVFIG